ncbi:MAG: malate dehydrogenase [Anaerohalosphaeraceae bacterium]|nr:malate dehydrogenase [Anaerohalosphaeraceae bacterium]
MSRKKIAIVGAGNVGASAAFIAANERIADVVLIDIIEGLPQGKALDMTQAGPIQNYDCKITGTCDWAETADSDIVIITSGLPRKPGMSRDDLLAKNTEIVKAVTTQAAKYSPESFLIVVCNPLDAMVNAAASVSGFAKNKVMGMAGALDAARFAAFIGEALDVSVADITPILMGGHGDDMVPLPRFTSVAGVPLPELMDADKIEKIVARTRKGGIEVVNLMGTSAYYAPAAGAVKMAKAILQDTKTLMPCCAYCDSEYGVGGCFVGVPIILGASGVEKVVVLDLNEKELAEFAVSASHVKDLVAKVEKLL